MHQVVWKDWAKYLRQWGLRDFAVWFLEASGPAHILGAQMVYVGQPLLEALVPSGHIQALVDMLEKPDQAKAFAVFLRED